ncbi:GspH/FimT family pseudopilin [Niveispirillum sp.]|uniref:GspH/FimT family pseudopilin n=1 Tax=Niveispirillum sp. TaxID=1917217 RepID=UPI001B7CC2DB|nr:GspH/FimT family pseudopilin [Niveispirillum sp.]MBP7340173.1 prepilin-type N-terminal cleavage/methylation domain-containing protein [Niveispirillum sp.]
MNWPSDRYRRQAGFTLLEMLVVLLLLGLATALVAPRLGLGGAALDADARALSIALSDAREQAVRTGEPVILTLDLAAPGGTLPATAGLSVTGDAALMQGNTARLLFLPDGSSSGAEIRLRGKGGGERVLQLDWLTGRVRHDAN